MSDRIYTTPGGTIDPLLRFQPLTAMLTRQPGTGEWHYALTTGHERWICC